MDKIISKRYYKIAFKLASALSVGSGSSDNTDKDIVKNGIGRPYIPGTALAGVYKSLLEKELADKYLGYMDTDTADMEESKVKVYDATLVSDKFRIGKRDCVALDDWKTAKEGAKFDFEVLEPGVEFVTYIEHDETDGDENIGDILAEAWRKLLVSFGSKSQRGLGRIEDVKILVKEFDFTDRDSVNKWIDFDMYDEASWEDAQSFDKLDKPYIAGLKKPGKLLKLKLKQASPITVRVYTTDVGIERIMPDYKQITYIRTVNGKSVEVPLIPGTTWAGAFRHRVSELAGMDAERYFGEKGRRQGKDNGGQKSFIRFSESEIEGATGKVVMRNSIDRFSGGAADTALFTEKMYLGGTTTLEIELEKYDEILIKALAAAITDLHMGFMSIGGETSIGHGLFTVEEAWCDGRVIKPDSEGGLYKGIIELLCSAESEAV